jgi:hypothetical protein
VAILLNDAKVPSTKLSTMKCQPSIPKANIKIPTVEEKALAMNEISSQ